MKSPTLEKTGVESGNERGSSIISIADFMNKVKNGRLARKNGAGTLRFLLFALFTMPGESAAAGQPQSAAR